MSTWKDEEGRNRGLKEQEWYADVVEIMEIWPLDGKMNFGKNIKINGQ